MVSSTKSIVRDQFEKNKTSWKKSFLAGFSQDENGDEVPWMTYPAIEFLKKYLKPEHEVFEFGCGASTLFFSRRVKKVVGLETNEKWLQTISTLLPSPPVVLPYPPVILSAAKDLMKQTDKILRCAQDDRKVREDDRRMGKDESSRREDDKVSEKSEEVNKKTVVEITLMPDGLENPAYESFAKNSGQKFDLIIIDSLKRFQCAKNSIDALKPTGAIILDDSERKNYQKIFDFFAEHNFKKQDFFGIAPAQLRIKNTTIFTR